MTFDSKLLKIWKKLEAAFMEKNMWKELGSQISDEERETLQGRVKEIVSQEYFSYSTEADWQAREAEVLGHARKFFDNLAVKGSYEGNWQDHWVNYLGGEGDEIANADLFEKDVTHAKKYSQVWAMALTLYGEIDFKDLFGEAAFDTTLKASSDVREFWEFSGTLVGYIASSLDTVNQVLRGNPYNEMFALYKAGVRPRLLYNGSLAVPIAGPDDQKTFWLYEKTNGTFKKIDQKDTL